ncbi:unnamed protein product [Prunus brigantina]
MIKKVFVFTDFASGCHWKTKYEEVRRKLFLDNGGEIGPHQLMEAAIADKEYQALREHQDEDGDVDRKLDSKPYARSLLVFINKRSLAQCGNSLRQRLNILPNPVQQLNAAHRGLTKSGLCASDFAASYQFTGSFFFW